MQNGLGCLGEHDVQRVQLMNKWMIFLHGFVLFAFFI